MISRRRLLRKLEQVAPAVAKSDKKSQSIHITASRAGTCLHTTTGLRSARHWKPPSRVAFPPRCSLTSCKVLAPQLSNCWPKMRTRY
jgi:hypothetical protein